MTVQELVDKLEECRHNLEGHEDSIVNDAFWAINELISDLENDGIDTNDGINRVYQGGY